MSHQSGKSTFATAAHGKSSEYEDFVRLSELPEALSLPT